MYDASYHVPSFHYWGVTWLSALGYKIKVSIFRVAADTSQFSTPFSWTEGYFQDQCRTRLGKVNGWKKQDEILPEVDKGA